MAKGGVTNKQIRKLGRSLAKVANQKSATKVKQDEGKVKKNG